MIVVGDLNHVELKAVLPKFQRFINFPTGDNNVLDQVSQGYPRGLQGHSGPLIGMSDHICFELIPAYKPLICRTKSERQSRFGLRRLPQHYRTVLNPQNERYSKMVQTWRPSGVFYPLVQ